jgi:RND family efflux transporter MFP subunit
VKNARVQVEAAQIALTRAKRLVSEQAGSRRALDEAQAQYDLAQKGLEAAQERRELLAKMVREGETGAVLALPLTAPEDGLVRNVQALDGQTVPAGAALFELIDLRRVWLRVPVYVGDRPELAAERDTTVTNLAERPGVKPRTARPVPAPPVANPQSATVDLVYELENPEGLLVPGQRVAVTIPLRGDEEALVVPWSAVIHDIHGNTWVYEAVGPHTFARRRVQVRHVVPPLAVLAQGPAVGTAVVTEGVAELYGTETGFAK